MVLGRQGPIAKMVTGAVGITQEYQADRKARKESASQSSYPAEASGHFPHSDNESDTEDDERWAQELDEAQAPYAAQRTDHNPDETIDDIIARINNTQPPPYSTLPGTSSDTNHLPAPVILPQRRPGIRTRGFVRGYAPDLLPRGVSQDAWLDFLNGFDKAISKNRLFFVLNLAVFVADHVRLALEGISIIAHAVSLAVQVSIEMSRRGYMHTKQNNYLDKLNETYFKPRGLYALVIKYKPKSSSSSTPPDPIEMVDLQDNIVDTVASREANENKFWKGLFKGTATTTHSEDEIPDFAPLIFPYLDDLTEAEKKSATKQKGAFLTDYFDRRAQSTFAADHPESKLANVAPRKEWSSEYADPTNPKSQGNLLSTVSGGHIQPGSRLKKRKARLGIGGGQSLGERRAKKKSNRPMKKLLRQDALYLMVVDLPSEREMEAVRRVFENV